MKIVQKIKNHIQNNNELLMTEEEFFEAYQKIKQDITNTKKSVDFPVAIVLGGQPGAGKSNIYQIARKRFSNNLVELDCDAFRVYHPYYEQIKLMFGKEDGAKTNPFVFKAVDMLVEELSDQKYNLIIESSLNRPNTVLIMEKCFLLKDMKLNYILWLLIKKFLGKVQSIDIMKK